MGFQQPRKHGINLVFHFDPTFLKEKYLLIYFIGRVDEGAEYKERLSAGSLPKQLQRIGLCGYEVLLQELLLVSYLVHRGPRVKSLHMTLPGTLAGNWIRSGSTSTQTGAQNRFWNSRRRLYIHTMPQHQSLDADYLPRKILLVPDSRNT